MADGSDFQIGEYAYAKYHGVIVRAGRRKARRIDAPAGVRWVPGWARRVEIVVSPTGRSVRVWVDGVEIPPPPVAGA